MEKETRQEDDITEGLFDLPPEKRDYSLNWWKMILFFATYYAITFLIGLITGVGIGVWAEITNQNIDRLITEMMNHPLITYLDYIGFIAVMLIFKSVRLFIKDILTWKPFTDYRTYLYIIGGFIVIYFSQELFIDILQWELISQQLDVEPFYYDSVMSYVLVFISLAIITPIQEEVMFRGVLQKFLSEKWRIWLGLLLSATIFGVLHPEYIFSGITMGLVFGIVYYRTRSLWPAIILHALWNGYIVAGDFLMWNSLFN